MCGPSECMNEWRNGCVDRVSEDWVCGPGQCGNEVLSSEVLYHL